MTKLFGTLQKTLSPAIKENIKHNFFNSGYSIINFSYYNEAYPLLNKKWKMPVQKSFDLKYGFDSGKHDNFCGRVIKNAVKTYDALPEDTFSSGRRYRAYSRYTWCAENNVACLDPSNEYYQGKNYNYVDGGKIRQFSKISDQFLGNDLVGTLLTTDIEMAHHLDAVKFDETLDIGLHQIRYRVNQPHAAYSSPAWLHRDDEPVVFVHVLNYTNNLVGADNVIAKSGSEILRVVKLQPLETMLLGKSVLHAVTPMSSLDETFAVRDILLVTFMNKKMPPIQDEATIMAIKQPVVMEQPVVVEQSVALASNFSTFFSRKLMPILTPSISFAPA